MQQILIGNAVAFGEDFRHVENIVGVVSSLVCFWSCVYMLVVIIRFVHFAQHRLHPIVLIDRGDALGKTC